MNPYTYSKNMTAPQWDKYNKNPVQSQNPYSAGTGFTSGQSSLPNNQPHHLADAILREFISRGFIGNQIGQVGQGLEQQAGYRNQLNSALNPANIQGMVQRFGTSSMARANDQGRQDALAMRGAGYGPGADMAAMIGARNQAANSTNQYAAQATSPEAMAQRAQMGLNLNDPSTVMSLAPLLMQFMNAQLGRDSQETSNSASNARSSGGLGGMFGGLLGTVAGNLDWTKILGGGK